jgi:hypothetical protein
MTLLFYNNNTSLLITFTLLLSFIFTVTGGMASVPFYDIWARSLPHRMLGTFFAHRHLWGGLCAILTGLVVTKLLSCEQLENQEKFALLFMCAAALMSIGFVGLGLIREQPAEKHEPSTHKRNIFVLARGIIYTDKKLRLYLLTFLLTGAPAMALPFLAIYAKERLSFRAADIGLFLAVQMAGRLGVTLVWGWVTDRHGCRCTAIVSSFVSFIFLFAAMMPFVFASFPRSVIYGVYALIGIWVPGRQICFDKMLLRMSTEKLRPLYIALKGTLSLPLVLYPLAGAFLLRWSNSIGFLLGLTLIFVVAGFWLTFMLPGSRDLSVKRVS